ncbi:Ribonuclease G [hydrothermal vent metagenome]|uniref:Ribonuclease G n=1 Tax=hydrothermal vent metagenome TaxID=652676 RepID=A0A3B1ABD1_9ZZZZ
MSEELLINVTPQETRIAYVENGMLQEVHIERARRRGLVGNIYSGKVSRVLPGMQAAFIDIGLERTAFLHASDIADNYQRIIKNTGDAKPTESVADIVDLLAEGQQVVVQVVKDPIGTKGARLTTNISIPSRYLVLISNTDHIGISQKIDSDKERQRLKDIINKHNTEDSEYKNGYIVRTVAEGISGEDICKDIVFLEKLWAAVKAKSTQTSTKKVINLLHEDLPLVMRTMRDLGGTDIQKIRIDSRETFKRVEKFSKKFIPEVANCIEYYPGERPIFDLYGVDDEIRKSLEPKVQLKSGGYLIIDQTEAMTTVDVNTGAFVGHRNLEETIFKTNLEATQAICRQVRLRNLGGIIIIDFIDMVDEEHKRQVLRGLEKMLLKDPEKTNISEVSSLGLVQMTRKRTRESLEHILCETCPTCQGRGSIMTVETVSYEIFREILRESRQFDAKNYLVLAAEAVVDNLLDDESSGVAELEEFIGKSIRFQVEAEYSQEQFDVVPM